MSTAAIVIIVVCFLAGVTAGLFLSVGGKLKKTKGDDKAKTENDSRN